MHAYASTKNGGTDQAHLYDSDQTPDVFLGAPDSGVLTGSGFFCRAVEFEQVHATATAGGGLSDVAKLYDSAGADLFEAAPDYGKLLYGGSGDHYVEAAGFRDVHAFATGSGLDTANLSDSGQSRDTKHEEATDYVLETIGPWIDSP